jgi:hypothetical protein
VFDTTHDTRVDYKLFKKSKTLEARKIIFNIFAKQVVVALAAAK